MSADLVETVAALSLILDEENARLGDPSFAPVPPALVAAKLRHVGTIEAAGVRLAETDIDPDSAARLRELIPAIVAKAEVNAGLLRRRIALCDELMGAITTEAQRLSGGRSTTYGAQGAVFRSEQAIPIAVNSRF